MEASESFFEKVLAQREQHYSSLITTLKKGKEACQSSEINTALEAYFNELEKSSGCLNGIPEKCGSWVEESVKGLDKEVVLKQDEQRFSSHQDDSITLKTMKVGKRLIRSAGEKRLAAVNLFRASEESYQPWEQTIPLQALAGYHLITKQEMLKSWVDKDAQCWISAANLFDKIDEEAAFDLEQIAKVVDSEIEKVNQEKKDVEEEIVKARQDITDELLEWAEKTGTVERKAGFYSETKIDRKTSQTEKELSKRSGQWQNALDLLSDRGKTIADFLQFEDILRLHTKEFADQIDEYFQSLFTGPLSKLKEYLKEELAKVSEERSEDLVTTLERSKSDLDELLQQTLNELGNAIEEAYLSKQSERFSEQVFLKANDLKKEAQFLHDLDLEISPPRTSNREIEWRVLVIRVLKEQLLSKVQPSTQHYEEFLETQQTEIEELKEVVDVNFESAIELCRGQGEEGGNPNKIIEEGIERTLSKIEQISEHVQEKQDEIKFTLIEQGQDLIKKMLQLISKGDSKELQIIDAKYKVKETAQGWRTKLGARWARFQDRLFLFSRFIWKKIKQYWSKLQHTFGFREEQVEEVKKADIATYLTETDAKIKELPYIYRKLFNFDVDADRRFYVSLHENFNYMKKAYESWENGFPATFATVGEKGSGKSTYLSLVFDAFFTNKKLIQLSLQKTYWTGEHLLQLLVDKFELNDVETKEEIVEEIRKSFKGDIMVVECLQNLYLRNVNGYQALEDLMYIISETKKEVFWIISCSRYAWNYLNVTHALGDYFSHIMRTDTLDEDQIESVVMNRHKSSGFELEFEADSSHAKSRAYRKLLDREEEAQQYLKERYFEDLADLSEGNASIAMIFWIRSIREFDDTHCYIKPLEITTLEMVQELKPDVLFTLAAIILHDAMTPKELSAVLQFDIERSRLILNQLQGRGLLQEREGQYVINQLMYRQVLRVLKERNIIHLV